MDQGTPNEGAEFTHHIGPDEVMVHSYYLAYQYTEKSPIVGINGQASLSIGFGCTEVSIGAPIESATQVQKIAQAILEGRNQQGGHIVTLVVLNYQWLRAEVKKMDSLGMPGQRGPVALGG